MLKILKTQYLVNGHNYSIIVVFASIFTFKYVIKKGANTRAFSVKKLFYNDVR